MDLSHAEMRSRGGWVGGGFLSHAEAQRGRVRRGMFLENVGTDPKPFFGTFATDRHDVSFMGWRNMLEYVIIKAFSECRKKEKIKGPLKEGL